MEWISVSEALPEEFIRVIVTNGRRICLGLWTLEGGQVTWHHSFGALKTITHWIPLPKPPAILEKVDEKQS